MFKREGVRDTDELLLKKIGELRRHKRLCDELLAANEDLREQVAELKQYISSEEVKSAIHIRNAMATAIGIAESKIGEEN